MPAHVAVRVVKVLYRRRYTYPVCGTCRRKVQQAIDGGSGWLCSQCGRAYTDKALDYSFVLPVFAAHQHRLHQVTLFGDKLDAVMGCSATEFQRRHGVEFTGTHQTHLDAYRQLDSKLRGQWWQITIPDGRRSVPAVVVTWHFQALFQVDFFVPTLPSNAKITSSGMEFNFAQDTSSDDESSLDLSMTSLADAVDGTRLDRERTASFDSLAQEFASQLCLEVDSHTVADHTASFESLAQEFASQLPVKIDSNSANLSLNDSRRDSFDDSLTDLLLALDLDTSPA